MRLLLENLVDDIGATRALVFGGLTEMLKQDQLISCFQGYTELIILKVLESHRDTEKDVSKIALCLMISRLKNAQTRKHVLTKHSRTS